MRRAGDEVGCSFPVGRALPDIRKGRRVAPDLPWPGVGEPASRWQDGLTSCVVRTCSLWLALLGVGLMTGCPTPTGGPDSPNDNGAHQPLPTGPTAAFSHSVVDPVGAPSTVLFNATESVEGSSISDVGAAIPIPIKTYTWDFGDGSDVVVRSDPFVDHTYPAAGAYTVTLTLEDEEGQTSQAVRDIEVSEPLPVSPIAVVGALPTVGEAPLTVNFDAAASDPGGAGGQLDYVWNFGDGSPEDNTAAPTHVYEDVGTYSVTLTVTNDAGDEDTATVVIDARTPAVPPPTTDIEADPVSGTAPLTVTFDGSESAAGTAESEIVEYNWDFGDGEQALGIDAIVTHTYEDSGSFLVQLTVVDDGGGSDTETLVIQVNPAGGERTLTGITVTPPQIALGAIGETQELTVTGNYTVAPFTEDLTGDSQLTYTSEQTGIVTVSSSGLVEAIGLGTATVMITHDDCMSIIPVDPDPCHPTVQVTVGTELVVQIARDPAGDLQTDDTLTLTASIVGGQIGSIAWSLTLDGDDATELLDPVDDPVTAVDTSVPGSYVASCVLEDTAGQPGSGSITFTVADRAGSLVVEAGDDIRAIPTTEDFMDDVPFADGALLTSGQAGGLIEGLSGAGSDPAHSVSDATFSWTPFAVPAPVAGDDSSPPDVLILTPDSPTTDFHIRTVPKQIALRSSGLAGVYYNRVVPGEYTFLLTVTNPIGPDSENVEDDTVQRTITPGFEVLTRGVFDQAFEGVAIRTGFPMHRVIGPDSQLLEFTVFTRQTAALSFDLFDDGSMENENGSYDPQFFNEPWCSGAGGCVSDLASFELTPGTAATPVEPPSIRPIDLPVTADSRGTYLIRAHLSDGAWVDTPGTERFPEDTGAVLHVQQNLPSVMAVTEAFENTPFAHIGLINSVTPQTSTTVPPVAVHGARTSGGAPMWTGEKIISQDLDRNGFPEVIVVRDNQISMFSGLDDSPYDVTSTLTAPAAAGATQLTLWAPFAPEVTETYWIEITNAAAGTGCAWRWQTAPGDGTGAVGVPYESVDYDVAFCLNPGAGEIICQEPDHGPHGTDDDYFSSNLMTADNFSMDENSSVKTISWWGIYEGADGPCTPAADDFRIIFYSNEDGLPAAQLATYNVGAWVDRTLTGEFVNIDSVDFPEHRYSATLLAAVDLAVGDPLTIDADNDNAEVVTVTANASDSAQVEVTALSAAHSAGAVVQGYTSTVAVSASPIDNSKNNSGVLAHDPTPLVTVSDGTITDVCFGDVNGDGFVDLIVGRGSFHSTPSGSEGRVDIYLHSGDLTFGRSPYGSLPDIRLTRPATERWLDEFGAEGGDDDLFGYSVASADVTGDGIDDVLVGAPRAERASGLVTTVLALDDEHPDDLLVTRLEEDQDLAAGDRIVIDRGEDSAMRTMVLGFSRDDPPGFDRITTSGHDASVGDSVQRFEATGAVFGFIGPMTSGTEITVEDFDELADEVDGRFFWFIPSGSDDGDFVGASVAVDPGASPSRIVLGAPGRDIAGGGTDAGAVFTLDGGSTLDTSVVILLTEPALQFEGDSAGLAIGRRVLSGHVTGASLPDIVASAANNTDLVGQGHTTAQGAVYVIPAGTASDADLAELPHMVGADVPGGGAHNHNLGASIALGDFNRDGFDDILITAPSVDDVNQRVFVVFGAPSFPQAALPFDVTLIHHSDDPFLNEPTSVAGAITQTAILYKVGGCAFADANGDKIVDLIFSGLTASDFQAVMVAGQE